MNRQEAEKIKGELKKCFRSGELFGINSECYPGFEYWFDKTYPSEPEYIPFEYTDFKDFMLKEVRRKGENFKDEIWIIFGATEKVVLITESLKDPAEQWEEKLFSTMFEEWEFSDGKPFGKLKQ